MNHLSLHCEPPKGAWQSKQDCRVAKNAPRNDGEVCLHKTLPEHFSRHCEPPKEAWQSKQDCVVISKRGINGPWKV